MTRGKGLMVITVVHTGGTEEGGGGGGGGGREREREREREKRTVY